MSNLSKVIQTARQDREWSEYIFAYQDNCCFIYNVISLWKHQGPQLYTRHFPISQQSQILSGLMKGVRKRPWGAQKKKKNRK